MRDWARSVAEKAEKHTIANRRVRHRANREKELFGLRARYVKGLFAEVEGLASAVNKELPKPAIKHQRSLKPKNLGGIEVPDSARLALEFLERRLEIVVQPVASVGGKPAPLGPLATASVIQYDRADPTGADWFEIALGEDGAWRRGTDTHDRAPRVGEKDLQRLIEWLVG